MHPVIDEPHAAPIDPGIPQRSFTEKDFEGEREVTGDDDVKASNLNFRPNQTKVSIFVSEKRSFSAF